MSLHPITERALVAAGMEDRRDLVERLSARARQRLLEPVPGTKAISYARGGFHGGSVPPLTPDERRALDYLRTA